MFLALALYSSLAFAETTDLVACEQITRSLMCVTDATVWDESKTEIENAQVEQSRACREGKDDIKDYVMEVYKSTPPTVQLAICNLKAIYIEETESGYGARVQSYFDFNDMINEREVNGKKVVDIKVLGTSMNINAPSRIVRRESCSEMHTRWLRGYFKAEVPVDQLPHYEFTGNDDASCGFRETLIHESGHIVDFAAGYMGINPIWAEQSFTELVTRAGAEYIPNFDPALVQGMWYDGLELDQAGALISAFSNSSFISFYGFVHPFEDFADEFLGAMGGTNFRIVAATGEVLMDSAVKDRTLNERIAKVAFMNGFLNTTPFLYQMNPHYEIYDAPSSTPSLRQRRSRDGDPR